MSRAQVLGNFLTGIHEGPTPIRQIAQTRLFRLVKYYAHTKRRPDGSMAPEAEWEPLFTEDCPTLRGELCPACETLDPQHGHLNKVAYFAGKFAEEMFPRRSAEAKATKEWGR